MKCEICGDGLIGECQVCTKTELDEDNDLICPVDGKVKEPIDRCDEFECTCGHQGIKEINRIGVKYIMDKFASGGVDDLKVKKEDGKIIIGYFEEYPVDCVTIVNNRIVKIVFSRQDRLNWLFDLYDNQTVIVDELKEDNYNGSLL